MIICRLEKTDEKQQKPYTETALVIAVCLPLAWIISICRRTTSLKRVLLLCTFSSIPGAVLRRSHEIFKKAGMFGAVGLYDAWRCSQQWRVVFTGPPTHSVGAMFCCLSSVVVVCHLSGSVTLHGRPAGGFTRAGQAMTLCRLHSNYSSTVTLHGGPVVLRPVRAIPCLTGGARYDLPLPGQPEYCRTP